MKGDTPRAITGNITFNFGTKYFFLIFKTLVLPNKNFNTQSAETSCPHTVARAAP